eukprot:GILK01010247.1.p1 GENE.GILK01010247.1~~GILK01010247.1.p1  ORF type:complete len:528 (+),score=111.94 GILK01010247.1:51-1634(+)
MLLSSSHDNRVRVWDLETMIGRKQESMSPPPSLSPLPPDVAEVERLQPSSFLDTLRSFVAIKTVSSDPRFHEQCWRGAKFLHSVLESMGIEAKLVQTAEGSNPLILGKIGNDSTKPTVLIYGHYDVQPAAIGDGWDSPPFQLTGRDGYLYGRGVTDDKGPVLAGIFAVKDVIKGNPGGVPPLNFRFIYEGEAENGSKGFCDTLTRHLEWLGSTDVILVSNNYWIGTRRPCLTYGLRGLINMSVEVTGATLDAHSGEHGGAIDEPLVDLICMLSKLVSSGGKVLVPGFYDNVRPLTDEELQLYADIDVNLEHYKSSLGVRRVLTEDVVKLLITRWRTPHLSIHNIETSSHYDTVIPRRATAKISIRTVEDQDPIVVTTAIRDHLIHLFESLGTSSQLDVTIYNVDDWWLGNPHSSYFKAAEKALESVWGVKPMYVREGGTIRATPFLERALQAPAVHIPLGQSTDRAHLENERIRMENLFKGQNVFKNFFLELAQQRAESIHESIQTPVADDDINSVGVENRAMVNDN